MPSENNRELSLSLGVLVGILMITAIVAINLLQRMAPAVERILEENVDSVQAVEEMLAVLAKLDTEREPLSELEARYARTLKHARANITELEEEPLIATLEATREQALLGNPIAKARAVAALLELGAVNRAAMERADAEAARLGRAGAWAVVLLGIIGLAVSLMMLRRLRRQLIVPLNDMREVILAHERGEVRRRCARHGSEDMQHVLGYLNQVLDGTERSQASEAAARQDLLSGVVVKLLDERGGRSVVVDSEGRLVAASSQALDDLSAEGGVGLRQALTRAARGETDPRVARVDQCGPGALLTLSPGSRA